MTDPARAPLLRLEVGRLRAQGARRRFAPVVHVGRLGAGARCCVVPAGDQVLDAGTRTELVLRLVEPGHRSADVWLTRPGEPVLQDEDLAWLSATWRALDAADCGLDGFWAVTRTGWLDVRTGERRTWKRLRL